MSETLAHTGWLPARRARTAVAAPGVGGPLPTPLVAVLCTAPRARVAAAGLALALAQAMGRPYALAGTVGEGAHGSLAAMPSAARAAGGLRERGLPAVAAGRLIQLADRRGPLSNDDAAGRAAAMCAELGRSATIVGAPAAVAYPFARIAALDRVLAWHDAIVVVREPGASVAVVERALESLAQLGRPVGAMTPPARFPGALAAGGLRAPAEALDAVVELALGDGSSGRPDA